LITITWTGELEELPKLQAAINGVMQALNQRADVEERSRTTFKVESSPTAIFEEAQIAEILRLRSEDKMPTEIAKELGISDARKVQGIIRSHKFQKMAEEKPAVAKSEPEPEPEPEPNPAAIPEAPSVEPIKPAIVEPDKHKSIGIAKLELRMYDLHKKGLKPQEIIDQIFEEGHNVSEGLLRSRLRAMGVNA